jgi:hypothetical protein
MRPFVFATGIPYGFAIGVLYITTQRATPVRWDTIRKYWMLDAVLAESWMSQLIIDNQMQHPFDSLGWWKTNLIGQ